MKIPALPPRPPLRLALTSKVVTHAPMFFLPRSLILGMSGLSAVATVTVPDVALLNCSRKLFRALAFSASWVPVVSVPQCLVVIVRQLQAGLPLTLFNSVIVNVDNIEHKPFSFLKILPGNRLFSSSFLYQIHFVAQDLPDLNIMLQLSFTCLFVC